MSEYWVSTPKYWCKHCSTFVVDTPISRKNHDATGKHQSALRKFLRDLHRENEKTTAASEAAKREVARLKASVSGQSDPYATAASSTSSTAPPKSTTVAKPELPKGIKWGVSDRPLTEAEKKRQMAELAALGVAMPDEVRSEFAMPGEWQTVSVTLGKTEKEEREEREREERIRVKQEEERKRKWDEMDDDEKELRGFKVQERRWPGADDEEEEVPRWRVKTEVKNESAAGEERRVGFKIEGKVKKEDMTEEEILAEIGGNEQSSRELAGAGEVKKEETNIKKEEEESPVMPPPIAEDSAAPPADNPPTGGVVFKKRKVKNIRKKD